MPDLDRNTWLLIGGAVVVVIVLVLLVASRRGAERVEREQEIRRSQTWRVVSVVILLALIVAFALANTHRVEVDWIFTSTQAPMVVVIGLSGGIGLVVGLLTARRNRAGET